MNHLSDRLRGILRRAPINSAKKIKADNEALILRLGGETCAHLPLIDSLDEVAPQSPENIARRICGMLYVIGLVYDTKPDDLWDYVQTYKLESGVSQREQDALSSGHIPEQLKIDAKWLCESAQALMWCLGRAEMSPEKTCDDTLASQIPFNADPTEFIATATLRPIEEIAREADLYYRLHWHTKSCRLQNKPCTFSHGIIMERRRALDWAYGVEADWDKVPLDT